MLHLTYTSVQRNSDWTLVKRQVLTVNNLVNSARMKSKYLRLMISLFLSSLILISFSIFLIFAIILYQKSFEVETFTHRYSENPHDLGNEISHDRLRVPGNFEQKKFKLYDSQQYSQTELISNYGKQEYECTGTCSCEDDRRGLLSSTVGVRKVVYVLAAVSSYLAVTHATKHFEDECHTKLTDTCPSNAIKSEVNECSEISDVKKNLVGSDDDVIEQEGIDVDNFDFRKEVIYYCHGHCVKKDQKANYKLIREILTEDLPECHKIRTEGKIVLKRTNYEKIYENGVLMRSTAIARFRSENLRKMCLDKSRIQVRRISKERYFRKDGRSFFPRTKQMVSMCSSSTGVRFTTNIFCKRIVGGMQKVGYSSKFWEKKRHMQLKAAGIEQDYWDTDPAESPV